MRDRVKAVLNPGSRLEAAAADFGDGEQFMTVAHAARNTNVPFMVLKDCVLNQRESLADAIHELKPALDAKAEVAQARAEALSDLAVGVLSAFADASPRGGGLAFGRQSTRWEQTPVGSLPVTTRHGSPSLDIAKSEDRLAPDPDRHLAKSSRGRCPGPDPRAIVTPRLLPVRAATRPPATAGPPDKGASAGERGRRYYMDRGHKKRDGHPTSAS